MKKIFFIILLNLIYSQADTTSIKFDPQTGEKIIIHKNKIKYDPMTGEVIQKDTLKNMDVQSSFAKDKTKTKKLYKIFGLGVSLTNNLIVICYKRVTTCNPVSKKFEPKGKEGDYPVYLVKYSRFGIINKYKYSYEKNDYINQ